MYSVIQMVYTTWYTVSESVWVTEILLMYIHLHLHLKRIVTKYYKKLILVDFTKITKINDVLLKVKII